MAVSVRRVAAVRLVVADMAGMAAFYREAFGFTEVTPGDGTRRLRLGRQAIELVGGVVPYPAARASNDAIFQHFAIVARDVRVAHRRLARVPGWSAVSEGGPVTLPAASGGVTAFKFRDPEGHPLELLGFPAGGVPAAWREAVTDGTCQGIDHTAIVVRDSAASVAFYEGLGFRVAAATRNHGPEQGRLDGLADPEAAVTALVPPEGTPHLELLCYARPPVVPGDVPDDSVAATVTVLGVMPAGAGAGPRMERDPDGHRVLLVAEGGG